MFISQGFDSFTPVAAGVIQFAVWRSNQDTGNSPMAGVPAAGIGALQSAKPQRADSAAYQ